MDYFVRIMISLTALLAGAFCLLYFLRPWLNKHLKITNQSIAIVEQKVIPKAGIASLLSISGRKYLVVSNANAIAISIVDDVNQLPTLTPENKNV
ncbi:hypothetical protein GCM10011613_32410 [Cellvibrio zantedeschiae]|uniref:Flagellar protein n=1 Tax=Cellvibrio zantedeschiae TaxID=1237077 RepID=A0ABQ3B8J1_9GAMM|nr:hypothetical protein [Cellvibrio zantedeschiae]GGY84870.1 hypothetical protein GCM10011613_32410 [Cellvibrio zantedeschiae]